MHFCIFKFLAINILIHPSNIVVTGLSEDRIENITIAYSIDARSNLPERSFAFVAGKRFLV